MEMQTTNLENNNNSPQPKPVGLSFPQRVMQQLPFTRSKKLLILAAIATGLVAIAVFLLFFQINKNSKKTPVVKPKATPSPTVIPTNRERVNLLDLIPIKKDGEYTFEYLSNAQTFYLRIENPSRDKEIRQEIADLVKKTTEEGNYCKFAILVWSPGSKNTVLPGC